MTVYSWKDRTIDRVPAEMPTGNKIILDGVNVSPLHIFEIQTGSSGYVRFYRIGKGPTPITMKGTVLHTLGQFVNFTKEEQLATQVKILKKETKVRDNAAKFEVEIRQVVRRFCGENNLIKNLEAISVLELVKHGLLTRTPTVYI